MVHAGVTTTQTIRHRSVAVAPASSAEWLPYPGLGGRLRLDLFVAHRLSPKRQSRPECGTPASAPCLGRLRCSAERQPPAQKKTNLLPDAKKALWYGLAGSIPELEHAAGDRHGTGDAAVAPDLTGIAQVYERDARFGRVTRAPARCPSVSTCDIASSNICFTLRLI